MGALLLSGRCCGESTIAGIHVSDTCNANHRFCHKLAFETFHIDVQFSAVF